MWAVYAILAAFTWAGSDAFAKRAMQHGTDGRFLLFARYAVSLPVLAPTIALGIPDLDRTFWLLHLPWVPLETAALCLYVVAIRVSPLSLTLPFLALTPLFILPLGATLLGESIGVIAIAGIVLIVVGSYTLNLGAAREDLLAPFRAVAKERGSLLMLIVAALYAVTSIIGKVILEHSDPVYFAGHYTVVMFFALAPLGLRRDRRKLPRAAWLPLLLSGIFFAASILFHMLGLSEGDVAPMIALKRTSGAFGVVFGALFFRERSLATRLTGSLIMAAGAALVLGGLS